MYFFVKTENFCEEIQGRRSYSHTHCTSKNNPLYKAQFWSYRNTEPKEVLHLKDLLMAEIFGPEMSVSFIAIENTTFPFHTEVFLKFCLISRLQECFFF
jgi:hypothetical protein